MRSPGLLFALTALLLLDARAQTPNSAAVDHLQRLQAERARLLAVAIAPIDRQYRVALDQLLKATMQRGDLDGAVKVRKEIARAASAAARADSNTTPSLMTGDVAGARHFAGGRWGRARIRVEFDADGGFRFFYPTSKLPVGTWKATSATTAVATGPDGYQAHFRWNEDGTITFDGNQVLSPQAKDAP